MTRPLPALAARIRRKLLERPGISPLPVCPACQKQVHARDFGRELCKPCEAERAAASEAWEAERWAEANGGSVTMPADTDKEFGGEAAARPFLPSDEED
jgi:hypothetical protein